MIYQIEDPGAINYEYAVETNFDFVSYIDRLHSILDRINFGIFVDPQDRVYKGKIIRKVDLTERIEDLATNCTTTRKCETRITWVYVEVKRELKRSWP